MENRCIICGVVIPEGRQVCPNCENGKPLKPKQEEENDSD